MREIKFRAWDTINKVMYQPDDNYYVGFDGQVYGMYDGDNDEARIYNANGEKPTLMQYSGLKDKNGTEIYEGDIISYVMSNYPDDGFIEYVEEVSFEDGVFVADQCTPLYVVNDDCEVKGNIYQHPELLPKEEE
jgi:uncharacterized phage protein (TIGR01671 family)